MRALLLLLAVAGMAAAACRPGEIAGVRCDLNGTLYYKECVAGAFAARERSCFAEGKACSVEAAGCVPAASCTADVIERCADGRQVVVAKCNMRMLITYQTTLYVGVAQPTGETCGGCAPGYACEGPAENYSAVAENFSVSLSLRQLDASGNPSGYALHFLRPGESASLRDLSVRLLAANASVSCTREGDAVIGEETALLEVSWGPAKSNLSLGEGEKSGRYCATYYAAPPCADIDIDMMIPIGGIKEDAACVPLAPPQQPPAPAPQPNATQQPAPNITRPVSPNITPPTTPPSPEMAPLTPPQNVTSPPEVPLKCLGVFLLLSLALVVARRP
ncbi:MAG: hypothetical protein QXH27_03400 [Candidatus Micrarchaeia archaeon]